MATIYFDDDIKGTTEDTNSEGGDIPGSNDLTGLPIDLDDNNQLRNFLVSLMVKVNALEARLSSNDKEIDLLTKTVAVNNELFTMIDHRLDNGVQRAGRIEEKIRAEGKRKFWSRGADYAHARVSKPN